MQLAAILMLSQMIFMLVASPLRGNSPTAFLAGSWAFVYTLQSVFAPDMISSLLATFTIFAITLSFSVGELIGCGGLSFTQFVQKRSGASMHSKNDQCDDAKKLKKHILLLSLIITIGVIAYAHAVGLFEARSFAELITLPGLARPDLMVGDRPTPIYSKVGILLAYSGVILALAYYYLYRWRWWLVLPMIGVILFGISQSGRAGTMIMLLQIVISIYLKQTIILRRSASRAFSHCLALPGALMAVVFIGGQFLREGFHSTESGDMLRVVTSLRSYLFGGVSAFSYWICQIYNWGTPTLGKYSFSSLFSSLGIAPQEPGVYNYYAPIAHGETSNLFTAYRSFIDDYSIVGACIFYCVAGIFIASITRRLLKGNRHLVLILIPLLSWLAFSPMASLTYFNSFLLSCIFPYLLVRKISKVGNDNDQISLC